MRSKGGVGSLHFGNKSSSRLSINSNTIFDGDIFKCNSRLRKGGNIDESLEVWELSKQLGMSCSGDNEEVVKEFARMEKRDKEIMKKSQYKRIGGGTKASYC